MESESNAEAVSMLDRSRAGWFWPVLVMAVALSFPYAFGLSTFFSHDDFAILWFHKDWPIWQPWVYLNPHSFISYRPLTSYTLQVLFQAFGLAALPFGLALLALHVANITLLGRLVDRLFGDRALTLLTVILFAVNWEYCDAVFWRSTFSTALSWMLILLSANALLAYLDRGRRWRYAAALALTLAALLSKEAAINAPLILTLVLWARRRWTTPEEVGAPESGGAGRAWATLREAAPTLAPFYALAAAFTVFRFTAVRDAYGWILQGYELQGLSDAAAAGLKALSFWLIPFLPASEPVFGARSQAATQWILESSHGILPMLALVAAVLLRNRRLLFGVLWAVLAFFPNCFFPDAHTGRYYYGSIMGISIFFAEWLRILDRSFVQSLRPRLVATVRVTGSLLIFTFVFINMFFTTILIYDDARNCRAIEEVYNYLVTNQGRVPPRTLFLVHCLDQQNHFHDGFGLREMFKLALADDSIEAILPDQDSLTAKARLALMRGYDTPVPLFRDGNLFRMGVAVAPGSPGGGEKSVPAAPVSIANDQTGQ